MTVFTVFQGEYNNRFDYGQGLNLTGRRENLVLDSPNRSIYNQWRAGGLSILAM